MFNNKMWLTPDRPTIVDIPKGASVIPEIMSPDFIAKPMVKASTERQTAAPVIINDYSELKREIESVGQLIRKQTKVQQNIASRREYEIFKSTI